MNNRITSIDNLRGIAAIMVVLYHFGLKFDNSDLHFAIGSYGVQMFFVISGFVIVLSLKGTRNGLKNSLRFIAKRMLRLNPPYLATILGVLLYSFSVVVFLHGDKFEVDSERILLNAGYLIPFSHYDWYSPVFWTLAVELQFYLLVFAVCLLPGKYSTDVLIIALILLGVLGSVNPSLNGDRFLIRYAGFFLGGVAACSYYLKRIDNFVFIGLVVASVLISFTLSRDVIGCIILCISIGSILLMKIHASMLGFFGRISYSLYLIHYTVMHILYEIFVRFLSSVVNNVLMYIFSILLTIACSYCFYLMFERPSIGLSKRIRLVKSSVNP